MLHALDRPLTRPAGREPVELAFFTPSPALQPYVSSYYLTSLHGDEGTRFEDWLLPEWASLRMAQGGDCHAAIGTDTARATGPMMATGPTSHATRIAMGPAQVWGIGILPLGWSRFSQSPASDFADRFVDGQTAHGWESFAPLYACAFGDSPSPEVAAARIDQYLLSLLDRCPPDPAESRIRSAHRALVDDAVGSVSDLAQRLDMPTRSLERFCLKHFGFPPKLLLRRQRFTRSFAQFLLDPSLKWIATLDHHYVDQAHFVRDFQRFMGMSPRAYARAGHPLLRATVHARAREVGGAVQALHAP